MFFSLIQPLEAATNYNKFGCITNSADITSISLCNLWRKIFFGNFQSNILIHVIKVLFGSLVQNN